MSNRKKSRLDRLKRGPRCKACGSRRRSTKEYDDAFVHICDDCHFPVRELK